MKVAHINSEKQDPYRMFRNNRRMYGFFRCGECNSHWESSHTYSRGSSQTYYKQDCKSCKSGWEPYKVEPIKCAGCGGTVCVCTREEKEQRHTDPNKPHRADLCHKCRSGQKCGGR